MSEKIELPLEAEIVDFGGHTTCSECGHRAYVRFSELLSLFGYRYEHGKIVPEDD